MDYTREGLRDSDYLCSAVSRVAPFPCRNADFFEKG
jgi:hypothetical protein